MPHFVERVCPACGETKEFRDDCKTCGCQGNNPKLNQPQEVNTITKDTWQIEMPRTRIHTLDQLIKAFEVDTSIWEVEKFIANKWEVGAKDAAKKLHIESLYQVKAWLRRKKNIEFAKAEIQELLELAKKGWPTSSVVPKLAKTAGAMFEMNLTDHHFGKLSWGFETGGPNYDVKIATAVFHRAFDALLARSPYDSYDEIWFIVGNDLFNADDTQGRTTSGTQVESDVRHEKTYRTVRTLLVEAIEKLRNYAKRIKVIVVPGNHDHNATWHLGDSLELYFSKYDDVEVDNSPSPRKYHRFGNTLIGYTHGHREKRGALPLLMTTEAREQFGQTKFHEWHTGHFHTLRVEETNGIRVRQLSALCPADAWHAENGYVGNLRSSEGFVWDRNEGLIATVIYNDDDDLIEKASKVPSVLKK